jgi:uncharacterized protein YqgC (DUF456 family)
MYAILIILVLLIMLVGLIGSLIPLLPGTPLIFLGALLYAVFTGFEKVDGWMLAGLGGLTAFTLIIDYIAATLGARRLGASWAGAVGAFLGAILGFLLIVPVGALFAPLGVIIGAVAGAVAGELLMSRRMAPAVKAGFGSFVGVIGGMVVRVAVALAMIAIFLLAVFGCAGLGPMQTLEMEASSEEAFLRHLTALTEAPEDSSACWIVLGRAEPLRGRSGRDEGVRELAASVADAENEILVQLGERLSFGPFEHLLGRTVVALGRFEPCAQEAGGEPGCRFRATEAIPAHEFFELTLSGEELILTVQNHFSRPLHGLFVLLPRGGHLVSEDEPARHLAHLARGGTARASWRLRAIGEVKRMPSLRLLVTEPLGVLHLAFPEPGAEWRSEGHPPGPLPLTPVSSCAIL